MKEKITQDLIRKWLNKNDVAYRVYIKPNARYSTILTYQLVLGSYTYTYVQ
jgi:hypothetical protein